MKKSKKLMINFLLYTFFTFLIISLLLTFILGSIAVYVALILYVLLAISTIIKAWIQVPYRWVYLVERYGKFHEVLKPGLHFVFPWLGLFVVKHKIFMGTIQMPLFEDEVEESEDYKEGIIDFKDESAKVEAVFHFKVTSDAENDLLKAGYETNDPIEYVKIIAETALKDFLAHYTLSEATQLLGFIDLNAVFLMKRPENISELSSNDDWKNTKYAKLLFSCGFTPIDFSITDIKIPNRVIEKKSDLMEAKNKAKIAEFEKEVKIKLSEGEAQALLNISSSRANEVKDLVKKTGMTTNQALDFITNRYKYEALAKAGNVTWLDGLDEETKKRINLEFGIGLNDDKKSRK